MAKPLPLEITPKEVKRLLDKRKGVRLVDVRERVEFEAARIEGAELFPMRTIPKVLPLLEEEENQIVVYCHHGMRSLQVVGWLREQGVENCTSMAGGIDRWSLEIDAKVPRYTYCSPADIPPIL
jgi:rhodanese-related sulfurtransferase